MPTLVFPPRRTSDMDTLAFAAEEAGWPVVPLPGWRLPETLDIPDPVLYSDIVFADVAAGPLGLALLEPPDDWPAHLPKRWSSREIRFLTFAEARKLPGPLFCKPAEDKSFPAMVYPEGSAIPGEDMFPPEMPVLISEPVIWEREYRCFVLDRRVKAISLYFRDGQLALDAVRPDPWATSLPEGTEEAMAFAEAVLSDPAVEIPPAVVLDVGRITGGGWAVVEANAAWGSGIYGCDPAAVLPVLQRACVPRKTLTPEDAQWVRPYREVIG